MHQHRRHRTRHGSRGCGSGCRLCGLLLKAAVAGQSRRLLLQGRSRSWDLPALSGSLPSHPPLLHCTGHIPGDAEAQLLNLGCGQGGDRWGGVYFHMVGIRPDAP